MADTGLRPSHQMRILADENFPKAVISLLRDDGHDVLWARTDLPGWKDAALLNLAESESRILLTLDKDFCQIAVQRRIPLQRSGVVLFRLHPATDDRVEAMMRAFLKAEQAWAGHVSIFTTTAIQMLAMKR